MVRAGGSQCGYCTPGFVVSLFCEYYRPGRDGFDPESISGNLCRCTGYRPIADVARDAAGARRPAIRGWPSSPRRAPPPDARRQRRAGAERFVRPTSLDDLFRCLAEAPDATLIAGGTDVMVGVTQKGDRHRGGRLARGGARAARPSPSTPTRSCSAPACTLTEIEEHLHAAPEAAVPLLEQLLPLFSSRLIRNRATLGGNLITASPIGDAPPVLLALDAAVTLASAAGRAHGAAARVLRRLPQDRGAPGRRDDRRARAAARAGIQRFYKVSKRMLDDISTVAAAFALDVGATAASARRASPTAASPRRRSARPRSRTALVGQPWTPETAAALRPIADGVGTPLTDQRGSAAYRRAMVGRLLEKCVADTAPAASRWERAMNRPIAPIARSATRRRRREPAARVRRRPRHRRGPLRRRPVARRRARRARLAGAGAARARARAWRSTPRPRGAQPGVLAVLTAADVPGENDIGPVAHDEPLFPTEVCFPRPGRRLGGRRDRGGRRAGARPRSAVDYEPLPAILSIERRHRRRQLPHRRRPAAPRRRRGGAARRRRTASTGELRIGGQEHFYLETQAALAYRDRRRRA